MNAKEEFLEHTNGKKVVCVAIKHGDDYYDKSNSKKINLPLNFTVLDYNKFLQDLDFEYDEGFGGQNLFGTIWYNDDTWSERSEYDGSEWWEYKKRPNIPKSLLKITKGS